MIKKKIAILGSTGSIGQTSVQILEFNKKEFNILLLSANSNYLAIKKQIKKLKPKYFVINNLNVYGTEAEGTELFGTPIWENSGVDVVIDNYNNTNLIGTFVTDVKLDRIC